MLNSRAHGVLGGAIHADCGPRFQSMFFCLLGTLVSACTYQYRHKLLLCHFAKPPYQLTNAGSGLLPMHSRYPGSTVAVAFWMRLYMLKLEKKSVEVSPVQQGSPSNKRTRKEMLLKHMCFERKLTVFTLKDLADALKTRTVYTDFYELWLVRGNTLIYALDNEAL